MIRTFVAEWDLIEHGNRVRMALKGPFFMLKFLPILLLVGCNSVPISDVSCVKIGQYASTIAKFRLMGMTITEVDALTTVPTASFIPAKYIAYDILSTNETPTEARIRYESTCEAHGTLRNMLLHMDDHRDRGLKLTRELSR
jgi:hypothetical protein